MNRIALISDHASPLAAAGGTDSGGQNVYVGQVARHLARRGCQVDVFTRKDKALAPSVAKLCDGVRVFNVPAGPALALPKERLLPHMPEFSSGIVKIFREQPSPYDLMHANFFMSGAAALPIRTALGIPLAITFHALGKIRRQYQGADDGFPDCRFDIEEKLVREADALIAECPHERIDLQQLYGAAADRIHVVPCGFDSAEFTPMARRQARHELGWPQHSFIVLQLGRLVPRKGIDNVVRAIAVLRRHHGIRALLYVVGGNADLPDEIATPEIARLRAIAHAEGVGPQVNFVGRRARDVLRLYYSAADVFVTTPWYEPFGITPVEAMACGLPVIGADVGGIKHTVAEGETGFLVPPRDPAMLARRLALLATNDALTRALGDAGRMRAQTHFTWSGVAAQLVDVYASLLPASARVSPGGTRAVAALQPPA
jgi:glycosyltransferase involved in cell wall biosynthesis